MAVGMVQTYFYNVDYKSKALDNLQFKALQVYFKDYPWISSKVILQNNVEKCKTIAG